MMTSYIDHCRINAALDATVHYGTHSSVIIVDYSQSQSTRNSHTNSARFVESV